MIETRIESHTARLRRIAALVLFVLFIHGVVWQIAHVHDVDHPAFNESCNISHSETVVEASGHHHSHQGECVLCQLQRQFLNTVVNSPARISPLIESKIASAAVFFAQRFYRSIATASKGGRGPPRLFLS